MDKNKLDYKKLGFKCGIEIHQQIDGLKLFCKCPTLNSTKEPDIKIERRLRASAGEMGKVDIAAQHEMQKGKKIFYQGNSEDVCLVELDEQPPFPINQDALKIALQVALLLNAKIVDEIQIMRKTVVDGSNTSGFQRTSLIASDGYIETTKGKIKIPVICLEEEACQKVKEDKSSTTYKLDRLGIPLIEIATDADIKDSEHAKEVATHIGMILRSVDGMKRGIGTIRQDVNISIKCGARTEIKGFQELKSIPKVIEFEVNRQLSLIKKKEEMKETVRKAEPDCTTSFLRPMPGADRMYVETDVSPIKITKQLLSTIKKPELLTEKAIKLEKKHSLSPEIAKQIIKNGINLDSYTNKYKNLSPITIANILIELPKEIKTRLKLETSSLKESDFKETLELVNQNKIPKSAAIDILAAKAKGEKININKFQGISDEQLEKSINKLISEKPNLTIGAYMGLLMQEYRGKVDGKKAMEILKKLVK